MVKSAGLPLNNTDTVKSENAITAGLTQKAWREKLDVDVPEISPRKAALRLLNQSRNYDLLLHEYYLTDKAGHSQEPAKAERILTVYDEFLTALMEEKGESVTIVLCSDHGNVEDLSTKTHTLNKVPLFVIGPKAHAFNAAESIMDVTPAILASLNGT